MFHRVSHAFGDSPWCAHALEISDGAAAALGAHFVTERTRLSDVGEAGGAQPPESATVVFDLGNRRLAPGEGELPLADLLAALPGDRVIGLEIPMRSRAESGVSAYDRLLPCVHSARALLAQAHEIH